ncbi:MAG TPA: YdiU family protein [Polyangiaceae bacterium]|jgi:uncharacterized protein YdiU (UPF0061 family)|nr:YdiU family protein [Polyangiaceae bacterium]
MLVFDNTYARLPDRFFERVQPTKVAEPALVKLNRPLAELLGADVALLESPEGAQLLAGNRIPPGAEPIALAYAGHQFGHFVPQLGDGRAILLGEVIGKDGRRRDIQLKGAGRTRFSRGGDGRAALGPVLREYVVSEAMAALGIPTTRALAAVTTGEGVRRDEILPGAILTRVAASHVRVGTFQYFAGKGDQEALRILTAYVLARHYPDAAGTGNDALALLERVIDVQAKLVAKWLGVGFVHGVMNTDNTAISGETLDYGPCAFIDDYDPDKTFSSIDHGGRYAFANQRRIALWNMTRLGEALLGIVSDDDDLAVRLVTERLERFESQFESAYLDVMRAKLGLVRSDDGDRALIADLLTELATHHVDYTVFFRRFVGAAADPSADARVASMFESDPNAFRAWSESWRRRLTTEAVPPEARRAAMLRANPAFIPRNHRVEQAIAAAIRHHDFEPFETLVKTLGRPYDDQPEVAQLAEPPAPEERVTATFCGT